MDTDYVNTRLPNGRVVHRAVRTRGGRLLTHCGYFSSPDRQTSDEADCESCATRRERIEGAPVGAGQ